MSYHVKEVYYTLQGEGLQVGRPAVFCRFSGCNLWSGREQDRMNALCSFCDTDFVGTDGPGGGRFSSSWSLADHIMSFWQGLEPHRYVVFTGGEPLLQLDEELIHALHERGFLCALETNGTLLAPKNIDWICVSPKVGTHILQTWGNELKLVFPQALLDPSFYEDYSFDYFWLQPMFGSNIQHHIQQAVDYCLLHPRWRLSMQTHKWIGIR